MDTKKCDICGNIFEFHAFSYERIRLPSFQGRGAKENNQRKPGVVGGYNSEQLDVCSNCFDKIVKFLKGLAIAPDIEFCQTCGTALGG